ncbi:MAG: flagellar hook capping protein [Hyphomicrobiales bacterium]|nr:MAG: flagellar hook capping protein [Hyphomicrobiales bacterium]
MDVTGTTSSTAATTSKTGLSEQALAQNYDMFLELLTVQIKNQNPLEPMDADKFTDQLTQFSSVEQQITTNKNLETLISTMAASNLGTVVSYIGKEVEAAGETAILENGAANWSATVTEAATATVTIKNSAGATIYTEPVTLNKGTNSYQWDGRALTGGTAPDGQYTISFSAQNSTGKAVAVDTAFQGVVDEVDFADGEPILKVGGIRVPLSSVQTIRSAG